MAYKRVKRKRINIKHKHARPDTHAALAGLRYNDFDPVRRYELDDEQARWDEAQDEASRDRAEGYEHTEDVP